MYAAACSFLARFSANGALVVWRHAWESQNHTSESPFCPLTSISSCQKSKLQFIDNMTKIRNDVTYLALQTS